MHPSSGFLNSRPDVSAFASLEGLVTPDDFSAEYIVQVNAKLKALKDTACVTLQFPALENKTLHLIFYSNVSFANRNGRSSQIGYPSA